MKLSVIVPTYNAENHIKQLLESFSKQSLSNFELIIIDDCSTDNTVKIIHSYGYRLIQLDKNHGPAYCRNLGAQAAGGEVLVFTDSDCRPNPDWLEKIQGHFSQKDVDAIMGRLELLPSDYIGNSISAMGFPAGGAIGFEKIWKVDQNGCTKSLSSCNCALRKDVFWQTGGFDESFPYPGGEDSFLAYKLNEHQYSIKFCRDVLVYHEARDSLPGFLKWQFRRGISSFIFSRRVKNQKSYISLRLWSTRNIIAHYFMDSKFPMILFLIFVGFTTQLTGFLFAKHNRNFS